MQSISQDVGGGQQGQGQGQGQGKRQGNDQEKEKDQEEEKDMEKGHGKRTGTRIRLGINKFVCFHGHISSGTFSLRWLWKLTQPCYDTELRLLLVYFRSHRR